MLRNKDILSIVNLTKEELSQIFHEADNIIKNPQRYADQLRGYVLATAFFEPSTRTKLSFQSAMLRLGGSIIDLPPEWASSRAKGENLHDTIKMLDAYSDIIVVRHKIEGFAKYVAEIAESPVINGGDGTRDHPTQAIIDLYTIRRELGKLENLNVAVLGDLRYGRASRSFIFGISKYNPKNIYLISPEQLRVRDEVKNYLRNKKINYIETSNLTEYISDIDVLYVTRIQKERFPDPIEYERVKGSYKLTSSTLNNAKDSLIILHPLPRVDELSFDVDKLKYARYFVQARYGVPIRMALLKLILRG